MRRPSPVTLVVLVLIGYLAIGVTSYVIVYRWFKGLPEHYKFGIAMIYLAVFAVFAAVKIYRDRR